MSENEQGWQGNSNLCLNVTFSEGADLADLKSRLWPLAFIQYHISPSYYLYKTSQLLLLWDDFKCLCLQLIFPLQDMPTRLQTLSDLVITPCPGLSRCWTNTFRMNEWMHSEPPVITILLSYPPLPRLLFVVWLEAINTKVSFRNTTQALISTSLYSILTHPWSHRIPSLASSHASRTFSSLFLCLHYKFFQDGNHISYLWILIAHPKTWHPN